MRTPFAAFACDDDMAAMLSSVAVEFGWLPEKVQLGGLRNAVQTLSVAPSPCILFVDLSGSGNPLGDIQALAEVCEPGTLVIAAGEINDVRLYRELLVSGIQDYLLKPFTPDQLRDVFSQAQFALAGTRSSEGGKAREHLMAAVIGVRGGVGASTIASSLAWLVADKAGQSTALLDLDIYFGTGALSLDLEPGRGLVDAIENPARIDGLFIERAMMRASETLSVLSAEAPINQPVGGDGTGLLQLRDEMRGAFDTTILDLPRSLMIEQPDLVRDARVVVLVVEFTLAAARDTIRILSWLKATAPDARVLLVANKAPAASVQEISRKDFENSIERPIDVVVPFDAKATVQAAKLGQPLARSASTAKIAQPLAELMSLVTIVNDEVQAPVVRGGSSLFGRLGGVKTLLAKRPKDKAAA